MINYKGKPLLGEDSSVSNTSEFFAIAGTILFWLIFLIFSFVIKPQPKKHYKEVQIVLSSTPVVQKTEESPAPAEQAASATSSPEIVEAPAVEAPVETPAPAPVVKETPAPKPVEKKVETPKAQTQPKPAAKKDPAPVKKTETKKPAPVQKSEPAEPVKYAVDPMEAFNNQTKQQPKKEFDWSQFDDEPAESQTVNTSNTVKSNVPAFEGSAGTAASNADQKVTSSTNSNTQKSQTASTSTSKSLEGIKNSVYKGTAANGVQTESTAKTKNSGSGKVEMEMSNGRSRALLDPARPIINLSAQAAATIDTSKTVSISFRVLEAGNVIEIKITPESILTSIVRDEIKNQISKWRFEPADYTANASFEYKIIKN